MVLLTVTPSVAAAVREHTDTADTSLSSASDKPITHKELIELSRKLRKAAQNSSDSSNQHSNVHLNDLLRGCRLYKAPPAPKPEPTPQYKALMARLRVQEEQASYNRMLSSDMQLPEADDNEEVTFEDINRQLTLIFNVLISIIGTAVAIWMAARYWDTPARLAISMLGAIVVAIAEVGVYMAYLRKVGEAKEDEKKRSKKEKKSVFETWVIEGGDKKSTKTASTGLGMLPETVKQRKGKSK